jgi:muramoyltetrapeptide carboxypeptidase
MKRKGFLHSFGTIAGLATVSSVWGSIPGTVTDLNNPVIPPYLQKGDIIGITSPAGYITIEEIQPAVQVLEMWGFRVKIGTTIGKRNFTFGGTDEERTTDLQQMLDDKSIKAILCARGGYGAVRIVDRLNWTSFKQFPKWVIGFSDITVLHCHINRNMGIASIHSKMCNSFPSTWANADALQKDTIESIKQSLTGVKMQYTATPHTANKTGMASGVLVGGNLKTIESLAASASDIRTANKILFVEDTGEYMYSMDRMFWNLQRSGKLENLKGLIVGGFKEKKEEGDDDFGKTLQDVVLEKVKKYNYPVCFDFPVGHQRNNYALKCGVVHRLTVSANKVSLQEQ